MSEQDERELVIKEALEWERTPYHHLGRVKGAGCDCLTFLAGVFENCKLLPRIEVPHYAMQWHLNQKAELYKEGLLKYTKQIDGPRRAAIALWKVGHTFSHGAIIIEWPMVIHSFIRSGVVMCDVSTARGLSFISERGPDQGKPRPVEFYDFWEAKK